MRHAAALCAGLIVLVAATSCRPRLEQPGLMAANAKPVSIKASCESGKKASFAIKPFQIVIDTNQQVQWQPEATNGNGVAVSIEPASAGSWPFANKNPTLPKFGTGVLSGPLPPNAPDDTVKYVIRFTCGTAPDTYTVVIDPDIIISGGASIRSDELQDRQ